MMCEHGAVEAPAEHRGLVSAPRDGASARPITRWITAITVVGTAAALLPACAVDLPAGLADRYSYKAVYATLQPPDTIVGAVRLTSARDDSVFGMFEDLDPDPDDAAQFGTVFPLRGMARGTQLDFQIAAPGVRIEHEGTRLDGTVEGTCSAETLDMPQPVPCTFTMWDQ